jgi:hypothetical protein
VVEPQALRYPPAWAVSGGHIIQTSMTYGGGNAETAQPGTMAVTGSASWEPGLTARSRRRSRL